MVYAELARLFRGATAGMKDSEVIARTGLRPATWDRMKSGQVIPEVPNITKFCVGLGLDMAPYLEARNAALAERGVPIDSGQDLADQIIGTGLEIAGLSPSARLEVMTIYRQLVEREVARSNAA